MTTEPLHDLSDVFTFEEQNLLDAIGALHGQFERIMEPGPNQASDMAQIEFYLHGLQDIMARLGMAKRFPKKWRRLGAAKL